MLFQEHLENWHTRVNEFRTYIALNPIKDKIQAIGNIIME
jgi:hypothetical protein